MPTDRIAQFPMQLNVELGRYFCKTFLKASRSFSIYKDVGRLIWSIENFYFPAINSLFQLVCARLNPGSGLDAGDVGDVRNLELTIIGAFVRIESVAWFLYKFGAFDKHYLPFPVSLTQVLHIKLVFNFRI